MSSSSDRPQEGTKVRLIGLKNLDLNGKMGAIDSYTPDGERVKVAIDEGRIVKVKPKQIQVVIEEEAKEATNGGGAGGGGGGGGMGVRQLSSKGDREESQEGDVSSSSRAGPNRSNNNVNGSTGQNGTSANIGRVGASKDNFHDNSCHNNSSKKWNHKEILDTLQSANEIADEMFDIIDTTGDGVITQEEFEYCMKKHTDHNLKQIRNCFMMIDINQNGDVTRDEVKEAFLKKKRELRSSSVSGATKDPSTMKVTEESLLEVSRDADALFDKADVDKSGDLSRAEFELFMKKHTSHSPAAIRELFERIDDDHDGFITRKEVRMMYLQQSKCGDGNKKTLGDILGLDDDEMADIENDVYSMFFLSDYFSASFWFAISVFMLKVVLMTMIVIDLLTNGVFPDSSTVSGIMKTSQFLLLPVNVAVQQELIATFYIYANLKWSQQILELNPDATKTKFHFANLMRFCDGLLFLFVNTTVLLQATQVVSAFLSFAALQFLSSIDNVALNLARDGYLSEGLEKVAWDVLILKLAKNHNNKLQVLDTILLSGIIFITVGAWILFTFVY